MEKCLCSRYQGSVIENGCIIEACVDFILDCLVDLLLLQGEITLHCRRYHLDEEEVLVCFRQVSCDLGEVLDSWKAIVDVGIAFFLHFSQAVRYLGIAQQTYVYASLLHHSLSQG